MFHVHHDLLGLERHTDARSSGRGTGIPWSSPTPVSAGLSCGSVPPGSLVRRRCGGHPTNPPRSPTLTNVTVSVMLGCSQVWLPTSMPSSTMRLAPGGVHRDFVADLKKRCPGVVVVQYAQQAVGVGAGSVVKRQRYQLGLARFLNDVAQAIPETNKAAARAEHAQRRAPRYCRHNFIPFDRHTMRMRVPAPLA